jgi:hypothetical protein
MQQLRVNRPTWPFSATTCRRVERTGTAHHSVKSLCARLSGYSGCQKLFPIRTLKRAEARAPERGIYAASSFAVCGPESYPETSFGNRSSSPTERASGPFHPEFDCIVMAEGRVGVRRPSSLICPNTVSSRALIPGTVPVRLASFSEPSFSSRMPTVRCAIGRCAHSRP